MPETHSGKATVQVRGDTEIVITREFDAPARLVWRAVTEPDLVGRWWVGQRGEMTECQIDLRVGGCWRYAMRAHDGQDVIFYGEYREIEPGVRIVQTEIFAPFPDDGALTTMTLSESEDGRTTLRTLVQHGTRQARDMHISSGMEDGMQEAFDQLEQVARSLD